jgi:hypothetical protein
MTTVEASKLQRNFGLWHDQLHRGPLEITRYGRTTSYLVSAELFLDMQKNYRKTMSAADLSDEELALIQQARVATDAPYNLDDIPDVEDR